MRKNELLLLGLTVGFISACSSADVPVAPPEPDTPYDSYDISANVSFKPATDASDAPDDEVFKAFVSTEGNVSLVSVLDGTELSVFAYEEPETSIARHLRVRFSPPPTKMGLLSPPDSRGYFGQSVTSSNIALTVEKGGRKVTQDVTPCSLLICWVLTSGDVFVTSLDPFAIRFTDVTLDGGRYKPQLIASGKITWKLISTGDQD